MFVKLDFSKGLLPAIVVDDRSGDVLMLAYMNEESYQKTVETKETWFYSRSREELWHKGATSGNVQYVQSIEVDCDQDTLLIRVQPQGPACHTGERTCFFQKVELDGQRKEQEQTNHQEQNHATTIFDGVMEEIQERKKVKVENSYTNYLLDKGIDKIGKKVIEEAGEVVIAAKNENKEEIVSEISDLIYHTFVLMAEQNVSLADIETELSKRFLKKGNNKGERQPIKEW
ncbi:bifunctional phosphoribosyl-AMP cyclohydrolase/phosphoribosyl-ATP diphosphatase HisIE [Aquibacillus sp. 3ASR75-11]|uniref:Histidine biosynthesis bifunctional protein HisIE n=1 Tax=Terrihalobacillus insolitus TaxID=2950438 RepID=A0A9X4ANA1_9BACI|nr:bifunctional phosphoribosyl-AMP cyclohydrolase/phosphoribosyl-ATP diphosphatase HisIE [Terrihalobacillus insolitus]MDC3426206.1 bifunctional phosphoribosyl-AMP cyclohydrolase/phosphoribosyl-ATP diphosphatase HisIE [Terrihalobacillus insolitus]